MTPLPRPETLGEAGPGWVEVCGAPVILGEPSPAVDGPGACGIARPVKLGSVAGVALDPPPVVTCPTARRLAVWLEEHAKPAFAAEGERLAGLDIAAGYVCRNVNYAEDGELSEHGRGRALDISGFRLADGEVVGVLEDWDGPEHGPLLRRIHAAACGVFGTALGPASDEFHGDHFHYDLARRRRPYCPGSAGDAPETSR